VLASAETPASRVGGVLLASARKLSLSMVP
jgi:hypothetical protein